MSKLPLWATEVPSCGPLRVGIERSLQSIPPQARDL